MMIKGDFKINGRELFYRSMPIPPPDRIYNNYVEINHSAWFLIVTSEFDCYKAIGRWTIRKKSVFQRLLFKIKTFYNKPH